jgi:hypothetical protein
MKRECLTKAAVLAEKGAYLWLPRPLSKAIPM